MPASEVATPGKLGRPKGSRNKATLLRLAREKEEPIKPKRKPGRPKGSKNKRTLEREARERAQMKVAGTTTLVE